MPAARELKSILLSPYGAAAAVPSPAGRMMAAVSAELRPGVDCNLGVGYVNEEVIPRDAIRDAVAAITADPAGHPLSLNYGGPQGEPGLRAAIRRFLTRRAAGAVPPAVLEERRVLVGANAATSLLEAVADVVPPGIVVTTDPTYFVYADYLVRRGFEIVAIPEDGDGADPEAVRDAVAALGERRDAIRFLYFMSVNNPTGTVLPNARRRALAAWAAELSAELGRRIPLILDRAYDDLIHGAGAEVPESVLPHDAHAGCFEIETLSKTVAPGLRIGFLVGPDGPFFRALQQRTGDVGFCAPPFSQAIAAHILDESIDAQIARVQREYGGRATAIRTALDRAFGDELAEVRGGTAGFYYYPTLRTIETSEDSAFFAYCMRRTGDPAIDTADGAPKPRVVYVPGEHCVQPGGALTAVARRQFRLSYAYEPLNRTLDAIAIMGEAAAWARTR
ncbi:MAG: aminotransferase class I/II-fold pyridoxal phosphate-dependent enzyme [Planctomycetota bacterium]|jgi:DNA-binding transcriptional MocR family regulator